jgi:hypothetical protein
VRGVVGTFGFSREGGLDRINGIYRIVLRSDVAQSKASVARIQALKNPNNPVNPVDKSK